MAEAWVYVDEAQDPNSGADAFRVGALVTEASVPQALVDGALDALRNDPDTAGNRLDADTLSRGYFHASADSKNAHSAICRAIVDTGLAAHFYDEQWHFDRHGGDGYSEGELHSMMNLLAVLAPLDDEYDAVHINIAQRQGSFDLRPEQAVRWVEEAQEQRLQAMIRMPHIPIHFPETTLTMVNGADPGVQVCDFVLWAVQRARIDGLQQTTTDPWVTRLKLRFTAGIGGPDPSARVDARLGAHQRLHGVIPLNAPTPRDPEELGADLDESLHEVTRRVRRGLAAAQGGARRVAHLSDRLAKALGPIDAGAPGPQDMVRLAEAFFLVGDTLPTYRPEDPVEWSRATELRRLAAAVADQGQIRWLPLATHWSKLPHPR